MYAQMKDGVFERECVGNTEFSPTVFQTPESLSDEQRAEFNLFLIVEKRPDLTATQAYGDAIYTVNGTTVERSYQVIDRTEQATNDQANNVRSERTQKLAQCDWTQLPDAPVDTQAWAAYRQALRDVTKQTGFPFDIQWPVTP